MCDIAISDNELHERLNDLIRRRGVRITEADIKYRGKLRTTKWAMFEAARKSQLKDNLHRNLLDL